MQTEAKSVRVKFVLYVCVGNDFFFLRPLRKRNTTFEVPKRHKSNQSCPTRCAAIDLNRVKYLT